MDQASVLGRGTIVDFCELEILYQEEGVQTRTVYMPHTRRA